jgi:hypothetical protein
MIIETSLDNKQEMNDWDNYVLSHPNGTPFHLSNWLKCIRNTYNHVVHLQMIKDSKEILGVFPYFKVKGLLNFHKYISIPFSDYGGILADDSNIEKCFIDHFINKFNSHNGFLEIRNPLCDQFNLKQNQIYTRHIIDLSPGLDTISKSIDKKTIKYSIRKAKRNNVEIKIDNTINGIEIFYKLNQLTRKKHGIPNQPYKHFKNIFTEIISKNLGDIYLALYNNKAIAAGLFLRFEKSIYYKYNASNPKYLSKVCPNHLLTYFAIENACSENMSYFDFGRVYKSDFNLIRFKKMWGASELELSYTYYPKISGPTALNPETYLLKSFTKVWQTLPIYLTKILSPTIFEYFAC